MGVNLSTSAAEKPERAAENPNSPHPAETKAVREGPDMAVPEAPVPLVEEGGNAAALLTRKVLPRCEEAARASGFPGALRLRFSGVLGLE